MRDVRMVTKLIQPCYELIFLLRIFAWHRTSCMAMRIWSATCAYSHSDALSSTKPCFKSEGDPEVAGNSGFSPSYDIFTNSWAVCRKVGMSNDIGLPTTMVMFLKHNGSNGLLSNKYFSGMTYNEEEIITQIGWNLRLKLFFLTRDNL